MTTILKFLLTLLIATSSHLCFSQTVVWDQKQIDLLRASSNETTKKIIKDADKLLTQNIQTVVDKEMTPPSGTKHDYMSAGRYWWPDPTKKDGLPYIRKDGVVNREIDNLDRAPLSKMCSSVEALSLAFYLSKDERYAKKAVENLRCWFLDDKTKMNPNMNFGQTIPGHNNGKGRGEGIIDTYSFVEMLDAIELLDKSIAYSSTDKIGLKKWFSDYLNWMLTSPIGDEEYKAKNNHGTAFDVQATRYALFTNNREVAKRFISEFPTRRLFTQIETDGKQPLELARTTALGYSIFNLIHIMDMCKMANTLQIDLIHTTSNDGRNIGKAVEYLSQFSGKTSEEFPYKQIKEWDVKQKELAWLIYRFEKQSGDQQFHSIVKANITEIKSRKDFYLY